MERPILKTDVPGYVADQNGAILNNDEQAWLKHKAARESARLVQQLKEQIAALTLRVQQLEERLG